MKPKELKDLKRYPYSHRRAPVWEMEVEEKLGRNYARLQKLKEIVERITTKNVCFGHRIDELLEDTNPGSREKRNLEDELH